MVLSDVIELCFGAVKNLVPEADDPLKAADQNTIHLIVENPDQAIELAHSKLRELQDDPASTQWARCYEEAQFNAITMITHAMEKLPGITETSTWDIRTEVFLRTVIERLDKALLISGAPKHAALIRHIFDILTPCSKGQTRHPSVVLGQPFKKSPRWGGEFLEGDRCGNHGFATDYDHWAVEVRQSRRSIPDQFSNSHARSLEIQKPVTRLREPTFAHFQRTWNEHDMPMVLTRSIDHWPALKQWRSPHYWFDATLEGRRLVPVEMGSKYTDNDWSLTFMPFGDFLRKCLLNQHGTDGTQAQSSRKGYLAQHDIFQQIPAVREAIYTPDFCYAIAPKALPKLNLGRLTQGADPSTLQAAPAPSEPLPTIKPDSLPANITSSSSTSSSEEPPAMPSTNIWLGPADTVTPLHRDPHHNILAQVFGRKYVRLFAPRESSRLYPMSKETPAGEVGSSSSAQTVDMSNTSHVDVGLSADFDALFPLACGGAVSADLQRRVLERQQQAARFPLFADAEYEEVTLAPGECLFIPKGWWHYVRSLDTSCSVSFWWD